MNPLKKTPTLLLLSLVTAGWPLGAAELDLSKLPPPSAKQAVTYASDIRPLLEASCTRCHSGDRPKAGLRLDTLAAALQGSKEGKVVLPGKSKESPLVIAVAQIDAEKAMPPKLRAGRGGPGGGGPGGAGDRAPGGSAPGGPAGTPKGGFGPPAKPLTPEQVGLVRAWIDQGAQ